jgi:hypothetical protein
LYAGGGERTREGLLPENVQAMSGERQIRIEGYTPDELLAALDEESEALLFSGVPVVFQAGSARLLGQFGINGDRLVLELAQIDGGGEGVLPTLASVAQRYARKRGLQAVEWLVYATACARPNLKLRRVLERRGFAVRDVPGKGECYHQVVAVGPE